MKVYKFILSGGGTGGHIYPAIAIANELKATYPNAEFLFVGAKGRMEMQKVPQAGYHIEGLPISGIQRSLSVKNLAFPFKLGISLLQSRAIIKKFRPHAVIGTGGFASAPLLRMAASMKIPCIIQEQNSYAGMANKWLSKKVAKICVAYEGMEKYFPKEKIVFTGNPVRQDLVINNSLKEEAHIFFDLDKNKKVLLVLGGSLGARTINQLVEKSLGFFRTEDIQILWQTGTGYYQQYQSHQQSKVKVFDFIYRMDLAYNAADVIVSRAGALSVSELYLIGKPVIFIPSPNVAEDHQKKNAKAVLHRQAAVMIEEKELDFRFETELTTLLHSEETCKKLSENIKKLAKPNAAKNIVKEIKKLLNPVL